MAIQNYDTAIRRRENFFQYYLQRGLAKKELGRDDAAVADLETSMELLPTSPAQYALGEIAEKRGNKGLALQYYSAVAGGQGSMAEAARGAAIRLDLEDNPDKYVRFGCYADINGELVVAIANSTPVAIRDVRFVVQYRDNAGVIRNLEEQIRGPIPAGQRGDRRTGLGPYTENSGCPVQITSARIAE